MVDVAQLVESRLVVPVVAGSSPVVHPTDLIVRSGLRLRSSSPEVVIVAYRSHWWWVPTTVLIVAAVSAAQVTAELLWLNPNALDATLGQLLLAHLIAAAACTAVFGVIRFVRSGRTPFLGYSERYLVGLGYGIVISLTVSIVAGLLAGTSAADAVEFIGVLMSYSLVSLELPVACIVGGLAWHLLTSARGSSQPPERRRRLIEDAE